MIKIILPEHHSNLANFWVLNWVSASLQQITSLLSIICDRSSYALPYALYADAGAVAQHRPSRLPGSL